MAADWTAIKTEYITTDISYRDLAVKHDVNLKTLSRRAKLESWPKKREEYVHKTEAKCLQKAQSVVMSRFDRMMASVDKLQQKIDQLLELDEVLPPRDLKRLSSTLLDVKMLFGFKDEEDSDNSSDKIVVEFVNNDWDIGGDSQCRH